MRVVFGRERKSSCSEVSKAGEVNSEWDVYFTYIHDISPSSRSVVSRFSKNASFRIFSTHLGPWVFSTSHTLLIRVRNSSARYDSISSALRLSLTSLERMASIDSWRFMNETLVYHYIDRNTALLPTSSPKSWNQLKQLWH